MLHRDKTPPSREAARNSVYSSARNLSQPTICLPRSLAYDVRLQMEGLRLLAALSDNSIPVVIFDPQYRGDLEHLAYGNDG